MDEHERQKATHEFFFRTLKKIAEPTRFDEIEKAYRQMKLDQPLLPHLLLLLIHYLTCHLIQYLIA